MTSLHRAPITGMPDTLLADCVLNMGKRGSGKSSTFRLAMERALTKRVRCGWIDAMGIGWGVAIAADGKTAGYPGVVVFGGEHGHLPISEGAGKALGTTLAKSAFSWVLDLKGLKSKAARVRFMADFVEAIYEHCDEPLLLFMDEVDLWAPQMIFDKQGPAAQLLGAMHELVRRGRVKGLSVWMATQRPAEVSKGIISQADALFTFKLMAPQDLDAAMSWMKGHIGKEKAAEWAAHIPALKKGEAIVYVTEPEVNVSQVQFPVIQTLDTFSPPKKGQAGPSDRAMAKIDLDAIGAQIKVIEAELAATDPKALNAKIRSLEERTKQLEREKAAVGSPKTPSITTEEVNRLETSARDDGYGTGYQEGYQTGWKVGHTRGFDEAKEAATKTMEDAVKRIGPFPDQRAPTDFPIPGLTGKRLAAASPYRPSPAAPAPRPARRASVTPLTPPVTLPPGTFTTPERKVLEAMSEWEMIGFASRNRIQVALVAGYHPRTGSFLDAIRRLRGDGHIIESGDDYSLAQSGRLTVLPITSVQELHDRLRKSMDTPMAKVFDALCPAGTAKVSRDVLAAEAGYHHRTGSFLDAIRTLRKLTICAEDSSGIRLMPWVFMEA